MSRTEYIYSDKLSLELFREGKRPVDNGVGIEGLLFINTKPTGSTKLAIRPKTGHFTVGEQHNQNPSASVHDKTNYLLFCNGEHVDPVEPTWDPTITSTNRVMFNGEYLIQRDGALLPREHNGNSLLHTLETDPNLVVLYDHPTIPGIMQQVLIFPNGIIGATNTYYIELDGVHINSRGESLVDALLNYEETSGLYIAPTYDIAKEDLITMQSSLIHNRDNKPHRLYIRYTGSDSTVRQNHTQLNPLIITSESKGYQVDPDGLGIEVTFAPLDTAYPVILPWYQYQVNNTVVGNRYVIEVNGKAYRDTRPISNISSPTASLSGIRELNPELATLLDVESGGEYNQFKNLTDTYLDIKIYLDENAPYHQNNKTVDTGDNPAGIYKKLRYPYGSELCANNLRKTYTAYDSVKITVTEAGLSFRLGPKDTRGNN